MDEIPRQPRDNTSLRGNGRGRGYGRGRGGGRGRGRGSTFNRGPSHSNFTNSVPSSLQVIPGAGVSIILKVDQPTGHQVQGIIGEVLGRGEHPRGIKVRLVDGRVGRVQAMVDAEVARAASEGLSNLGRNGENAGAPSFQQNAQGGGRGGRPQFTDMRYDDPYDYESSQAAREGPSLLDYVKPKRPGGRKSNIPPPSTDDQVAQSEVQAQTSNVELIMCPVCGDFEGDEEAVAFHVNSHFD